RYSTLAVRLGASARLWLGRVHGVFPAAIGDGGSRTRALPGTSDRLSEDRGRISCARGISRAAACWGDFLGDGSRRRGISTVLHVASPLAHGSACRVVV